MDLLEQFKVFVKNNNLLRDARPTLLAVSGGLDSVVMAHLFRAAAFPFGIAHCNFQLRGTDSDGDEVFVKKMAVEQGVPFFAKRFDTKTYAETNSLSIQMAARALRYAWFREIAASNGFARIATAHHLNDSVETALLNFVRGTGLVGLSGIKPLSFGEGSEVGLIRPLLFATRADIEDFAKTQKLVWREDSSNASDDYARNFLRHRVLPLLEELNPSFLQTAARNLLRLRETSENLDFLLQNFLGEKTASDSSFFIEKQKLAQLPAPRRALRELLKKYDFTEEQARQVAENLEHIGLEIFSNSGWRLLVDRSKIFLAQTLPSFDKSTAGKQTPNSELQTIQADDLMLSVPGGGRLFLTKAENAGTFPDGREAIVVDAEKLQFPLLLRLWQPGDSFQPFGMGGHSQKLQDFFTNLKLSRLEKEKIRVLENGDGVIVWVVGHRLDERFKVTPETKSFLKISWLK
jgi:tRNA(Ile)-lysidine synthase